MFTSRFVYSVTMRLIIARHLVISLLLGAVCTLAVAWWIAARIPMGIQTREPVQGSWVLKGGERAPYLTWSRAGQRIIKWHWYLNRSDNFGTEFPVAALPWWSEIAQREYFNAPGQPFVNVRIEYASGWPLPAMRYAYWVQDLPSTLHFEPYAAGYELSNFTQVPAYSLDRKRALPLRPVYLGFAVNTIVFGSLALVILGLARWRMLRTRRVHGRCVACGYDRHGLVQPNTPCPECGNPPPLISEKP